MICLKMVADFADIANSGSSAVNKDSISIFSTKKIKNKNLYKYYI